MYSDWTDYIPHAFTIGFVLVFCIVLLESIQDYRATPAEIVCRQKQMESVRRSFHSSVVCVPIGARRDTLYIQIPK